MEGPDPHLPGEAATQRLERGVDPRAELLRGSRLKVIAQIDRGGEPSSMSHAIRATSVVVLPLPAGATHSTGRAAPSLRALIGGQPAEPLDDCRVTRHRAESGPSRLSAGKPDHATPHSGARTHQDAGSVRLRVNRLGVARYCRERRLKPVAATSPTSQPTRPNARRRTRAPVT
jgi:hypothetical protein